MQTDRHDGNPTSPTAWLTPNPSGSFPYGIGLSGLTDASRPESQDHRFAERWTRIGNRRRIHAVDPSPDCVRRTAAA